MSEPYIVTFSHLRWDFVYQRPQHLMSRLARQHSVLFIEEPVQDPSWTGWEISSPALNVLVHRPHTPYPARGFTPDQYPLLQNLLDQMVSHLDEYIVWLYTPMALPMVEALHPEAMIYDCMDELSLFFGAPTQLAELEAKLVKNADLIFTGGRSLFKAKQALRSDVYCFPSSVDAEHFKRALKSEIRAPIAEPADQVALPHPRLGFFGVIDERIDLGLLLNLADAHKEWQIILVGPVVKIDPSSLPQRPNLHYLGKRKYEELPAYVSGWDICLLPFALNDATRFISPTKTLEYMAAERPIVSTPISDVVADYGGIVYVGEPSKQFCIACEEALHATTAERTERRERMRQVIARTSWDRTAQQMEQLILNMLDTKMADNVRIRAS